MQLLGFMMLSKSQKGMLPRYDSGNHVKKLNSNESDLGYSVAGKSASVEIDYFNYTNKDVIVVDHTGLALKFKPLNFTPRKPILINKFVVRKKIKLAKSAIAADMTSATKPKNKVYTQEVISNNEEIFSEKLLCINETINSVNGGESVNIYFIEPDSLCEPIYVRDVDVMVYDSNFTGDIIHPNSARAMEDRIEKLHDNTYCYNVEINDPEWLSDYYFINLNNKVTTIIPNRDKNKPPEAKLTFKEPNQPVENIYVGDLSNESLSTAGVFKTFKDASDSKNKLELLKDSLEYKRMVDTHNLTAENSASTHIYKMTELSNKMEATEKAHKLALQKLEDDNLKLQRDMEMERRKHQDLISTTQMKDYYEQRSYERKDSSEGIKLLPTILGAGLGLLGMYAGFKK